MMGDILIATPSLYGETSIYYTQGIAQVFQRNLVQGLIFRTGEPHQVARDGCVHAFKQSPAEWLVFVDDDIGFTAEDFQYLMEGDERVAYAPALRKRPGPPVAVNWGLAFAKIHRSVFELLDGLNREDGSPFLRTMRVDGNEFTDYFPQGIDFEGRWRAEDHAFWSLVAATGCSVKVENRTRLVHSGRMHWHYQPEQMTDPCKFCGVGLPVCDNLAGMPPCGGCCEDCDHDPVNM